MDSIPPECLEMIANYVVSSVKDLMSFLSLNVEIRSIYKNKFPWKSWCTQLIRTYGDGELYANFLLREKLWSRRYCALLDHFVLKYNSDFNNSYFSFRVDDCFKGSEKGEFYPILDTDQLKSYSSLLERYTFLKLNIRAVELHIENNWHTPCRVVLLQYDNVLIDYFIDAYKDATTLIPNASLCRVTLDWVKKEAKGFPYINIIGFATTVSVRLKLHLNK